MKAELGVSSSDYKALLIDLDGTLTGRDEQVSAQGCLAVCKVIAKLHVSIVSGREPSDVLRFVTTDI